MPYVPPPELASLSLAQIAEHVAARALPPIEQWQPSVLGDSRMEIHADGRWFHEGGEITRPAMVRAFASLLMREEDGSHWLCTPHEKLRIAVADAAFMAIDVERRDDALAFRLNTDDLVICGPDFPLRAAGDPETPALYLAVRHGCEARLNRRTYGEVVEMALAGGDLSVTSRGALFSLVPR